MNLDEKILEQLTRIADALEKLSEPEEPLYVYSLAEYQKFDWSLIDASIVQTDSDGPTQVKYHGHIYTRRNPSNKYGDDIFYTRAFGKEKGDKDKTRFLRLITFKGNLSEPDPVPTKTARQMARSKPAGQAAPSPAAPPNSPRPQATPSPAPPPLAPPEVAGPMTRGAYELMADSEFGFSKVTATSIATLAGVKTKDPQADFTPATALLPYFQAAFAADYTFAKAVVHFHNSGKDPVKAIEQLEKVSHAA